MRIALFMLFVLAACGGGTAVTFLPDPPAAAPPTTPPGAVLPSPSEPAASAPVVVTPAWTANWTTVLAESWGDPRIGGWMQQEYTPCGGGVNDTDSRHVRRFGVPVDGWTVAAGQASDFKAGPLGLAIDSVQPAPGWGLALLSGLDLDHLRPIRMTGVVDLRQDDGAWVGLTIHAGEGNYREGGFAWYSGQLRLLVHAPCYVVDVGSVEPGARALAVEYHPEHGWRISVDGVARYTEPIDYRRNRLQADPRAGVWAVNLLVESGELSPGRVRALVGEVVIQVGSQ